jgi:hypothetical protein
MPHECLQRPGIDSTSRQGVAGSVAQHVRVDWERQPSGRAKPVYELLGAVDGKGRLTLRHEHEICVKMLAPECPQQSQLVSLQAMNARRAILGAADIDSRGIEVDLLPADIDQLTHPQGVPECHQDQQPIADWVAAVAGGGNQAIDLAFPSDTRAADIRRSLPDHRELSAFQTARAVIGSPYSYSPSEHIDCRHNDCISDSCKGRTVAGQN